MTSERAAVGRSAAAALAARFASPKWIPLPHQIPPQGDWYGWLLLAGRGAGKTDACAAYIADHVKGPPCLPGPAPHWIGIIGPTQGDAVTSCVNGPSGLKSHDPTARLVTTAGGTVVRWPNGSEAKIFGANSPDDVERLRSGGNRCVTWCEELAAWRHLADCWDHMRFGLRVGPRPHWVGSTTPKPKPLIIKLSEGKIRNVVLTSGVSTYDNPHLPQHIRDALEETYAGTQLGSQELLGRILEEDENALWTRATIEAARIHPDSLPSLVRSTVGVDPSGGAGEQGIVVTAKSGLLLPGTFPSPEGVAFNRPQVHGFVLADETCHLSPEGWGRRAVQTAIDWETDDICVEVNYGGDQAVAVIRAAAERLGVDIPIRQVRATRGKEVRAGPVSALSEQLRFHHAGVFEALETQMTTWYPEIGWSPDRIDGCVWGPWHMKLVKATVSGHGLMPGKEANRVIGGNRVR